MSGKRITFIGVSYLIVALLLNFIADVPDSAWMIAFIVIIIISFFVYPSEGGEEKIYPGRDPRE